MCVCYNVQKGVAVCVGGHRTYYFARQQKGSASSLIASFLV